MSDPIISIRDLEFAWGSRGGFAIAVPHLEVGRGERVMLLGPSGSGKSTLLSLIAGVLAAQSGTLSVLGTDLTALSSAARDRFRAEHIGVIFQQFNLLPYGTILDNVVLPLSFAHDRRARTISASGTPREEARRLLAALGLGDIPAMRRASDLSIGQQQRVAVARALIGSPELMIADEPTSALDQETQGRFLDLLFGQIRETGSTLLMVSHDERLAPRFDRVIRLGDIVEVHHGEAAA